VPFDIEPEIADGATVLLDKNELFKAGDLVILFKRPELALQLRSAPNVSLLCNGLVSASPD